MSQKSAKYLNFVAQNIVLHTARHVFLYIFRQQSTEGTEKRNYVIERLISFLYRRKKNVVLSFFIVERCLLTRR